MSRMLKLGKAGMPTLGIMNIPADMESSRGCPNPKQDERHPSPPFLTYPLSGVNTVVPNIGVARVWTLSAV